MLGYLAR
jgi:methylmalonyl-CoA mutase